MMVCKICGHENVDAKFCEKCGSKLEYEVEGRVTVQPDEHQEIHSSANTTTTFPKEVETVTFKAPAGNPHTAFTAPPPTEHSSSRQAESESSQLKPYLESAKQNSKIYFNYFITGLKSPLRVAQKTGSEQLLNGIISMVIFAILLPLMLYLSLGSARGFMRSPFVDIVLKPVFWLALFIFLIAVYTFGAVKLSTNPRVGLKEVIARFGTLLIPFIVIFLVAFLFLLMGSGIGNLFITIALLGTIFTIPALITLSYKRESPGGIDTLYSILLIYAAVFLTIFILGDSLGSMLGSSNFFGF
ncbi:zinc ribbon domain-containing protein [Paenibacillus uliginis]|nr:zinc ribbon domain-containing protein [Paenibacillus uliginis]